MSLPSSPDKSDAPSFAGDFWGGLASMLVALPSSVAFGILVYSTLGPEYSGRGAMAGLLGAAVMGLVTPFIGRNRGLISAPCAPAAAVLSAFIVEMSTQHSGGHIDADTLLPLMAVTVLLSGLFQILYGVLGGGKLIKFIPYQVVSGYLSGVGLIIAIGQIPKLFGFPKGTPLFTGLFSPHLWKWPGLVVGIATIVVTVLAPKLTKKVPAAICGLFAGITTYFILGYFVPSLLQLQGNPSIIGPIKASGSFVDMIQSQLQGFLKIDFSMVKLLLFPACTLSVLLSIDTLKTCVGLDAITRNRHDPNRELIGQGTGNLVSSLVGGMPGAGTMGPSLVNVTSGGKTPRAGIIEGVFVLLALALLGNLIAWVPIGALAGILLVIAWRMFDRGMFKLALHPLGRVDFAVIASVVIVAVSVDLIAASGVGIGLAIFLFIREQIRSGVIFRKSYLNHMSSKTQRQESEREVLSRFGEQGVICMLQGNLFFGTTDQLLTQLDEDLRTKRFLMLDLRRVRSIDYTAVHLFSQIHSQLKERNGRLMFSGMPSGVLAQTQFQEYLQELGLLNKHNDIVVWETLDEGLEWMESQILASNGINSSTQQEALTLTDFSLFRKFDEATIASVATCIEEKSVAAGERLFATGDAGDEVFLVRRGSVRILLPLAGGKVHHLATVSRGGIFGEMAFLDHGIRSAHAEAKEHTEVYILSRARFNERSRADATVGVKIFARIALITAKRLRAADAELRLLEER